MCNCLTSWLSISQVFKQIKVNYKIEAINFLLSLWWEIVYSGSSKLFNVRNTCLFFFFFARNKWYDTNTFCPILMSWNQKVSKVFLVISQQYTCCYPHVSYLFTIYSLGVWGTTFLHKNENILLNFQSLSLLICIK